MDASAGFRLPDGWTGPETIEDVIVADEVAVHRAGLAAIAPDGEEVCGSAAEAGAPALGRAWFELLERVSIHEAITGTAARFETRAASGAPGPTLDRAAVFPVSDAPERWTYARSNGIALHADWPTACRRALFELAERDRVVRSWYGDIRPDPIDAGIVASVLARASSYDWRTCAFPEADPGHFSAGVEVVGIFGLPRKDDVPFVLGLAGRADRAAALEAAAREALQLLAFLWGEALPDAPPPPGRPGAMHHLDTYQVRGAHEAVRRWLEGGHVAYSVGRHSPGRPADAPLFVDLTPEWLPAGLRVAKAWCPAATPLVFGDAPHAAHLPPALRLHPIP